MIAFGPIPSRRLGRSLGVNHIPPKSCTYDCVYCQVGPTQHPETLRRGFYPAERVREAVSDRVAAVRRAGEPIDFLTFVPDGEPTLDLRLADEIDALRGLGIAVAVISNGSLTWRPDVRADLGNADVVCVKVDAIDESTWRRVNRPAAGLSLTTVLDGLVAFADRFRGRLLTETMLVGGVNDGIASVRGIARLVQRLHPEVAYLLVPTRPPSESWVRPPAEESLNRAYQVFAERLPRVELLAGFEGVDFGHTGDARADLLGVTAVHPLRDDAAREIVARDGGDPELLERLADEGVLMPVEYRGERFWIRRLQEAGGKA